MNRESGEASLALIVLAIVLSFFVIVLFFVNRVEETAHYTTTTICSAYHSAADGEYHIHTADSGDYHIDRQFSNQQASRVFHQLNQHLPGTYSVKWYSNFLNGSQALDQATLLPASAQQNLCPTKK